MVVWNTGMAAERARSKRKQKPEPPANKRTILKLHNEWCRANGYKRQAASAKLQATSA